MSKRKIWISGIKDGIPIGLGYLAVSFAFGIQAEAIGLQPWQAALMSLTNVTSAGQFAALGMIAARIVNGRGWLERSLEEYAQDEETVSAAQ